MANVKLIRAGLATRIGTATGLRSHATAPGQVNPPAVVIIPSRPAILYAQTMAADFETTVNLIAVVLLSAANDTSGQQNLDDYVSSSGTASVFAAVQADPSLGGTCEFAGVTQVSTYGIIEYAGQQYLGASFLVQCGAHV